MDAYLTAARMRQAAEQQALIRRAARAWELARQAANLLRTRYAVQRVAVFGSLVRTGCFTEWSDVDLATWGLAPQATLAAMGDVFDLGDEIELNLVDVAACSAALRAEIERWGVDV
jgi:predicted nucleotidyltransferase